jgi:hypothetical protein
MLSLVEHGWQGARQCSLALKSRHVSVTHVVKGWLERDLRAMIEPHPHIRVVSAPRWAFRLWVWPRVIVGTLQGRLRWILMDHERSHRELAWWCRCFGILPVMIQERDGGGYDLEIHGRRVSLEELLQR